MQSHYNRYFSNINRIRLSEMIDFYSLQERIARARPSLVANPLTGETYGPVCCPQSPMTRDATP